MEATDDSVLLRQYADSQSEEAFAGLVERHINLVYSVALRQTSNPQHAEEITQAVFIILAKKSTQLRHHRALSSWLFQTTRLTANNFIRGEVRRHHREQEAYMQTVLDENKNEFWPQLAPWLDAAVGALGETDRRAIVLRFYEGRNAREVAAVLGISEDAAKKRVARALEKMQRYFQKRGVQSTTAMLAETIPAYSLQTAPIALVKAVTAVAVVKGATASASTLTLIKGALKIMAWSKAQTVIVAGAVLLVAAGTTTTIVVKKVRAAEWEVYPAKPENLYGAPQQATIRRTKFPGKGGTAISVDEQCLGLAMDFATLLRQAYGLDEYRMQILTALPTQKFDYISNYKMDAGKALQEQIRKQFGIVGRFEPQAKDCLLLEVKDAALLQSHLVKYKSGDQMGMWIKDGRFTWSGQPSKQMADWLEGYFQKPVVNLVDVPLQQYTFGFQWSDNDFVRHDTSKLRASLNEIGLDLIETNQPIDILVVEKAK